MKICIWADAIVSLTLNEAARRLKERLEAIMKHGNGTKKAVVFTIILTMFITYGAVVSGAYAAPVVSKRANKDINSDALKKTVVTEEEEKEETKNNILMDIESKNSYNIAESGSFEVDNEQTLSLSIKSNIKGGTVDLFLFDPKGNEQRITIGSKNTEQ